MKTLTSMHDIKTSSVVLSLAAFLVSFGAAAAEDTRTEAAEQPESRSMSGVDALQAMRGMGGYYRVTPEGDFLLYPTGSVDSFGTYREPLGRMQGMTGMQGIAATGGVSGYFHIEGDGDQATFYPYPGNPVGMSGMSGRPGMQ